MPATENRKNLRLKRWEWWALVGMLALSLGLALRGITCASPIRCGFSWSGPS